MHPAKILSSKNEEPLKLTETHYMLCRNLGFRRLPVEEHWFRVAFMFGTFLSSLLHFCCVLLSRYRWRLNKVSNMKIHMRFCSHCLVNTHLRQVSCICLLSVHCNESMSMFISIIFQFGVHLFYSGNTPTKIQKNKENR